MNLIITETACIIGKKPSGSMAVNIVTKPDSMPASEPINLLAPGNSMSSHPGFCDNGVPDVVIAVSAALPVTTASTSSLEIDVPDAGIGAHVIFNGLEGLPKAKANASIESPKIVSIMPISKKRFIVQTPLL
jgi:hypothetical protein